MSYLTPFQVVDRSRLFLFYIAFLMLVSLAGSVGRSAALRTQCPSFGFVIRAEATRQS